MRIEDEKQESEEIEGNTNKIADIDKALMNTGGHISVLG